MSATGALAMSGLAAPVKPQRIFLWEQYYLKSGSQPERLHEYMRNGALPAHKRAGGGPAMILDCLVGPHRPLISAIFQFDSIEHMRETRLKMVGDKDHQAAFAAWENHTESPHERMSATLLQATDYCPELTLPNNPPKAPRVFELRVYHSPSWRQLAALHERFAGPEIKIFHRVGVRPILYSSTVVGSDMPNLTYVIPFDNLTEREKAWAAFGADPEWIKVRKESIDKSGQISSVTQIYLYTAMPYSPIR